MQPEQPVGSGYVAASERVVGGRQAERTICGQKGRQEYSAASSASPIPHTLLVVHYQVGRHDLIHPLATALRHVENLFLSHGSRAMEKIEVDQQDFTTPREHRSG